MEDPSIKSRVDDCVRFVSLKEGYGVAVFRCTECDTLSYRKVEMGRGEIRSIVEGEEESPCSECGGVKVYFYERMNCGNEGYSELYHTDKFERIENEKLKPKNDEPSVSVKIKPILMLQPQFIRHLCAKLAQFYRKRWNLK